MAVELITQPAAATTAPLAATSSVSKDGLVTVRGIVLQGTGAAVVPSVVVVAAAYVLLIVVGLIVVLAIFLVRAWMNPPTQTSVVVNQ